MLLLLGAREQVLAFGPIRVRAKLVIASPMDRSAKQLHLFTLKRNEREVKGK